MNCASNRELIDQLIFEENDELLKKAKQHTLNCQACQEYMIESKETAIILKSIQRLEPIIDNPENLTDSILAGIENVAQEKATASEIKISQRKNFIILQRILAAASVCIFLVFGFEQYAVVNKISDLEVTIDSTPANTHSSVVSNRAKINTSNLSKSMFYSMIKKSTDKQIVAFLKNHSDGLDDISSVQQQDLFFNSKFYKFLNY